MNGWFLAFIILHVISLSFHLQNHGKNMDVKYDFWKRLISSAISLVLVYMAIKTGF